MNNFETLEMNELETIDGGTVSLGGLLWNMGKGAVGGLAAGGPAGAAMGLGLGGIYYVIEDSIF